MMAGWYIWMPLVACLAGAVCAAAVGVSGFWRRVGTVPLGWVMGLFPATGFAVVLWAWWASHQADAGAVSGVAGVVPGVPGVTGPAVSWPWIESLGLIPGVSLTLRLDGLSLLFALLVTGIGALVHVYAGYYFDDHAPGSSEPGHTGHANSGVSEGQRSAWRFLTYLSLFTTAMLGVVLAGDLVLLFVFWECTSVASFLLIGFKGKDPKARAGAMQSLLITGLGGVALLLGVVLIGSVVGSTDIDTVRQSGDLLRGHAWYPWIVGLICLGAFTKSAQVPFHLWLPNGMTAPTPASAFLHSATMVKAGIYLLAKLNPALGFTELWFWALTLPGLATMLLGAYLGMVARDLKALLAYTTLSQLGAMVMLIGDETAQSHKALVVVILAHALYKSSLFMLVGVVDHAAGTRDLGRLGGLMRAMPMTMAIVALASASMAGLPPLFGYVAKDALVASATHPSLPAFMQYVLAGGALLAGAVMLALSVVLVWEVFLGRPRDEHVAGHAHDPAWGMLLCPALPALLGVLLIVIPSPIVTDLWGAAASSAMGQALEPTLKLWKGLTGAKMLSIGAIVAGVAIFVMMGRLRGGLRAMRAEVPVFNDAYARLIGGTDALAWLATRVQNGQLHRYLLVMLSAIGLLAVWAGLPALWPSGREWVWSHGQPWPALRVAALLLACSGALATVFIKRDLFAIFSLGASGLGVALVFLVQPAPDVALVMILVDVLTVVVLVLALSRIPRVCLRQADELDYHEKRGTVVRDTVAAVSAGLVFAWLAWEVMFTRPGDSRVSPFYLENAKTGTGASDVVGAILIDFRGLDTLLEVGVFSLAGLGVYALLRYASPKAGDVEPADVEPLASGKGTALSTPMVRMLANALYPLAVVLAITHAMYGHGQPGDGFTAGVILALAVSFRHVVLGLEHSRMTKPWLKPTLLVGGGLLLGVAQAVSAYVVTGTFFGNVDYGAMLGLPLPEGFAISTSFFFEVAIMLAVFGGATLVIDSLSEPVATPSATPADNASTLQGAR